MSEDEIDREVVSRVGMDRRSFVKRAILGAAFAVPVVASFEMEHLTSDSDAARAPYAGRNQHMPHSNPYYPDNLRHHGIYGESHTAY